MALHIVAAAGGHAWDGLRSLVDADGSAAHPFVHSLAFADRRAAREPVFAVTQERRADTRAPAVPGGTPLARRIDLCDAAHALCAVHGARRGLVDEALDHPTAGVASEWLADVASALATERTQLSRLVAAAGPLPSTPGQAATDAAFAAQRHAFHMLARSDRAGVATGAAAALVLDWVAVRAVLARAAEAFGMQLPPLQAPAAEETAIIVDLVAGSPAAERALLFGARALLAQHRAFWDILEARSTAREG